MLFGFDGFHETDFDLYSKSKGALSIYNSKRFLVRNKLDALGESLLLENTVYDISDSAPSGWNKNLVTEHILYFIRPKNARESLDSLIEKEISFKDYIEDSSIYHNHLMLGLRITEKGIFVYLHLNKNAVVDYRNLKSRLEYEADSEEFKTLFNLPVLDKDFNEINDDIFEIIEKNKSFSVGKFYPKDSEILKNEFFEEEFKNIILSLKPLYDFILWVSENDNIEIKEEIKENKIILRQAGLKKGDKVRILSGIFRGKTATLNKITKKGKATININGIRSTIDASELTKI